MTIRSFLALAATLALTVTAVPATAAPASIGASDQPVSFTQDGTTAYGTLHIPAHRAGQRLAAALLLPGSGPTDRNGNDPGLGVDPNTLALLANVLGQQGIISLRFDKYFSGHTGAGAYASDPGRIDLDAFVRQADAAYRLLAGQPQTDPRRMLVVGHSEGGFTGLLVAESVAPRPAGLALLEPQDERTLDLIGMQLDDQLDEQATAGQITDAVARANEAGIARVIAAFRADAPLDFSGLLPWVTQNLELIFQQANLNYLRTDDAIYPPTVAARLAAGTRVLVTDGTGDTQIPLSTTPPLIAALHRARTSGPGLVVLPGVDHFLHPAGDSINDQILAPSAVHAVIAFVSAFAVGRR